VLYIADYTVVDDDEFDVVVINGNSSAVPEDHVENHDPVTPSKSEGADLFIPDSREQVELYAWNVIISMVQSCVS
jgi:hypothetical protein